MALDGAAPTLGALIMARSNGQHKTRTKTKPRVMALIYILINGKLELRRRTLESKGFRLSRTKTEYMLCDFSSTRHEGGDVSLDGQVVAQMDTFRYLGSVL